MPREKISLMKTIGFLISSKPNERRRAILPEDFASCQFKDNIFVEEGYGEILGYSNEDFLRAGVSISTREEVMKKDIIVDPKIGDADYLPLLSDGTTLFGWHHLVQNRELTDLCIEKKFSCFCWENMFDNGRHIFWKNNQIAGEAAVLHAFESYGRLPIGMDVAILGNGNVSNGALRVLSMLGANVQVYRKEMEHLFKQELSRFDVIVNAVLWDVERKDHIIYRKDFSRMKPRSLIIDVSCDHNGAIEGMIPTSFSKPMLSVDGIYYYAVDHTPSIFYRSASESIGHEVARYLDQLISGQQTSALVDCLGIREGIILDPLITAFQNR